MATVHHKRKILIDTIAELPLSTEIEVCDPETCDNILSEYIDDIHHIVNDICIAIHDNYYLLIYEERVFNSSIINLVVIDYHDIEHAYMELDFESSDEFMEYLNFIPRIKSVYLC